MALTNGVRLGPYEILAPLGQGGMGSACGQREPLDDEREARESLQPPHILAMASKDG